MQVCECLVLVCLPGLDFQPCFSSLDFLSKFNTVGVRKNPAAPIVHSSPLNIFVDSPIKEEDESKTLNNGRQESHENLKQVLCDPDCKIMKL